MSKQIGSVHDNTKGKDITTNEEGNMSAMEEIVIQIQQTLIKTIW